MAYLEEIKGIVSPSLDEFIGIAYNNLPKENKQSPWIGLSHGVKILENENELNQYLCAYGHMHQEKLSIALESIDDPKSLFKSKFNIIDWGCGQGLATICCFDFFNKLGLRPNIGNITLIEPSKAAIKRANENIGLYNLTSEILPICKYIDDIEGSDIKCSNDLTIHLFSNILDIETVNLQHLADTINKININDSIFICVGPQNIGSTRIKEFAQLLHIKEEDLIEDYTGKLSIRGTINLLIFRRHNNTTNIIKVAYQHVAKPNIQNSTALQRILHEDFSGMSYEKRFIHYYRKIIEYEKLKSESIIACNCQCYPLEINEDNDVSQITIDIEQNKSFEKEFIRNFDTRQTAWPKNLNIGLCIILNDKAYRILKYIYPYEDIKSIDITSQYISVNINNFSLDSDIAEELGLGVEIIDAIEHILSEKSITFFKLEKILKDALNNNLILEPTAYLALTSENPALTQIYKELKTLENLELNDTLSIFLRGHINDNIKFNINKDALIHIKDMDESQRQAIAASLNHKFSVITGPPGTGKTQLILNLIANALIFNKSVLVASKNNKAVDNIKDRYDNVDENYYLLRFGSIDTLKNQLIPYLETVIDYIPKIDIDKEHNTSIKLHYKQLYENIHSCREFLHKLTTLRHNKITYEQEICNLNEDLNNIKIQYDKENISLDNKYSEYREYCSYKTDWEHIIKEIQKCSDEVLCKSKGFKALLFNWLYYNKLKKKISLIISYLPFKDKIFNIEAKNRNKREQLLLLCNSTLETITGINTFLKEKERVTESYFLNLQNINSKINKLKDLLTKCHEEITQKEKQEDSIINSIYISRKEISNISLDIFKVLITDNLTNKNSREIVTKYKNYIGGHEPIRAFDDATYLNCALDFLSVFKLNTVTNLSVKNAYPIQKDMFDLLIIDEASQCDIASAIPLMYRAKQVIVIGDPLQLKHISSINISEENEIKSYFGITENPFARYVNYSLWDYCKDLVSSAQNGNRILVLDNHYRCNPQIIGYSNEFFYKKKLNISLNVKTIERHPQIKRKGIIWIDVCGQQMNETSNINMDEVEKSIELAIKLANEYKKDVSIGIISPFKDQIREINARIPKEYSDKITSNTVHAFQGDEKDIIIYSLVVTDNSPISKIKWIDYSVPNLVNVAVTRARTALYIVGNRKYIHQNSRQDLPLGYLEMYSTGGTEYVTYDVDNKSYIIDTNIFIDCTNILDSIPPTSYIIIPAKVIDELEKLKINDNDTLRTQAEKALRAINKFNNKKLRIEISNTNLLPIDYNKKQPDNMILSVAIKYQNQNPTLLSSDNGLLIKSKALGIRSLTLKQFINNNYE